MQAVLRHGKQPLEVSRRCVSNLRETVKQLYGARRRSGDNAAMTLLRIATRKSPLALWQSEHVATQLRAAHPGLRRRTGADDARAATRSLDRSLAAIGGKGLFLKELEVAMQRGDADCAVHSLKDVPMELEPASRCRRSCPRRRTPMRSSATVRRRSTRCRTGARVGTSSLRRQAQLRALRPDLRSIDLRGNVNTRLAKLDAGDYDAIVLACAGLQRLGFDARIRARLDAPDWLPAPAQGAIAIECRDGDSATRALCALLDDAPTRTCVEAERAMNRALHGSCHVPVAAYAQLAMARLRVVGAGGIGAQRPAGACARGRQCRGCREALGCGRRRRAARAGRGGADRGQRRPDSGPYVS